MLYHPDPDLRWKAIDALRDIAEPLASIPIFVRALHDDYWRARALAAHALYDLAHCSDIKLHLLQAVMPLARALQDECDEVCLNAAFTLELLGAEAKDAVPLLNLAVQHGNEKLRRAASDALAAIGQG